MGTHVNVVLYELCFVSPASVLPFLPSLENAECIAGACSMSANMFRKCPDFQNIYVVLMEKE